MKVGTDGILLGAWAPLPDSGTPLPWRVVDVGTGTGLLALMLAQRLSAQGRQPMFQIDALEPEPAAAQQAHENVQRSPWSNAIHVHRLALQEAVLRRPLLLADALWVSNPPFFESEQFVSPDPARARARHESPDFCAQLFQQAGRYLHETGQLAVILPLERESDYAAQAQIQGFMLHQRCTVRHSAEHPIKRVLLCWGRRYRSLKQEELCLKTRDDQGLWQDSAAYTAYVNAFYLRFAQR